MPSAPQNAATSPAASAGHDSRDGSWAAAVAAVVLIGGALRLLRLGHEGFWLDESYVSMAADRVLKPWTLFSAEYINDAPLIHFVAGFWSRLIALLPGLDPGSVAKDFAMRLPSAAFGTASVWGVYWFTQRLLRARGPALTAAFIFAISPFQLYYAQDLRPYALHVGISIVATVFLLRSLEGNRPADWAVFAAACTLGIYNHFIMVFNVMAMNIYFAVFLRQHFKLLARWIAANLAIIALASPGLVMMLRISGVFESASEDWYPVPGVKLMLITYKNYFAGYSPQFLWYRPLSLLAAALAMLGVWSLRRDAKRLAFLLIMGVAPLAIAAFYWRNANFPYYTHRLMIFSAVPVYALVASGIAFLPRRGLRALALVGLAGLMLPGMADYYAQRVHPVVTHTVGWLYKADTRGASGFVRAQFRDGDVIVHRLRYSQWPFRYYMGWDGPNYIGVPTQAAIDAQSLGYPDPVLWVNCGVVPQLLDGIVAGKTRVWYVDSWWRAGEEDGVAQETIAILASRGKQVLTRRFDALTVYLFDMSAAGGGANP